MYYLIISIAAFFWMTPFWYPLFYMVRFRMGYGPRRLGRPRKMTIIDWLNATGMGIFIGSLTYPLTVFLPAGP